jgi:RNA polymerase sigma-70 factor, ECF subfamily
LTPAGRTRDEEAERRLIEGLQQNDRESIAAIYDAYGAVAYSLAARLLGRSNEAEDVVQESFLALWRQAERIEPARGIQSYLMTIVHNKAIDRLRSLGRRPESDIEGMNLVAPSESPEDAATRAIDRDEIKRAMSVLPEEQRRAVEMTYFLGMTINEVARRMSVPAGTVKSRLRLALVSLRRAMGQP